MKWNYKIINLIHVNSNDDDKSKRKCASHNSQPHMLDMCIVKGKAIRRTIPDKTCTHTNWLDEDCFLLCSVLFCSVFVLFCLHAHLRIVYFFVLRCSPSRSLTFNFLRWLCEHVTFVFSLWLYTCVHPLGRWGEIHSRIEYWKER